jgi:formate dehydrogenase
MKKACYTENPPCASTTWAPHISGNTLSAQARYAARTLEILQSFLEGTPIREKYLIVAGNARRHGGQALPDLIRI